MIDERVQACRRVDIDFWNIPAEEMRQRSARLVFRVQIQQLHGNLIRSEPLGQGDHDTSFADAAFASHRQNYPFLGGWRRG